MRDYVPNFKVPSQKKPSVKMWITIALCVLLPPVGMILLWGKTRCPIRGKVLLTAVSVAVMAIMIALIMQYGVNAGLRQSIYTNVEPTPLATPVPVMPTVTAAPAEPQGENAQNNLPDGVIPANPAS